MYGLFFCMMASKKTKDCIAACISFISSAHSLHQFYHMYGTTILFACVLYFLDLKLV